MNFQNKKIKIVIIDYPIYVLDDPTCSLLFGKMLKMKTDGYCATYSSSVLPVDKSDFFGTHIMLCEETESELIPMFAYKAAKLDRCLKYKFEFPIISIVNSDCNSTCSDEIKNIINNVNDPSTISYDSAWAQNLNYRFSNNLLLKKTLREITMMMAVMHHKEFNIPHIITLGVLKVKTDQFFSSIGLNKLNVHFNLKGLDDEECAIFYNNSFSLEAHRMAKKYKELWDNKLVIDGVSIKQTSIKRAS